MNTSRTIVFFPVNLMILFVLKVTINGIHTDKTISTLFLFLHEKAHG